MNPEQKREDRLRILTEWVLEHQPQFLESTLFNESKTRWGVSDAVARDYASTVMKRISYEMMKRRNETWAQLR